MSGWAIVAVVAIVVWGITQMVKARHRGDHGNSADQRLARAPQDEATQREIEQLRERIRVLEKIATDSNSQEAIERRRISQEIESLRDEQAD